VRGHISPDSIRSEVSGRRVFACPDFFIDHFVKYPRTYPDLLEDLDRIMRQKGGNILGTRQYIAKGGNAVNTAIALGRLGVSVTLFTKTDRIGHHLLGLFTEGLPVDLSLVGSEGSASITAALEVFEEKGRLSNVMISDSGSLLTIGPEDISPRVESAIRSSDVVCFFNWAQTRRGTEIAKRVFSVAKEKKGCLTLIDVSDPSYRQEEIPSLIAQLFKSNLVDVLSLNENELSRISKCLGMPSVEDPRSPSEFFLRSFSSALGCSVDYHDSDLSMSVSDGESVAVPSFEVSLERVTGAGDAWNAGDITGYLAGLDREDRLLLANATAGFYISNPRPAPPTLDEVVGFIEVTPRKKRYQRG